MYYEQVVLNRFSPEIPLCSGIKRVQDFVADLARAGKSFTEIKKTVEAA
jgi:hypothetical protein